MAWENIHSVGDIIGAEKGRSATFFMDLMLRDAETARFHSKYVSSVLARWITDLSQQAAEKIQVNRCALHLLLPSTPCYKTRC